MTKWWETLIKPQPRLTSTNTEFTNFEFNPRFNANEHYSSFIAKNGGKTIKSNVPAIQQRWLNTFSTPSTASASARSENQNEKLEFKVRESIWAGLVSRLFFKFALESETKAFLDSVKIRIPRKSCLSTVKSQGLKIQRKG